jgi:sugar lactone lactonase YvrE
MSLTLHKLPLILSIFVIASCGGGGGSTTLPEPPTANVAPVAIAQDLSLDEDFQFSITLSGTDTDGSISAYTLLSMPQFGSLTGAESTYQYTPNANYNGNDQFTFNVTDNDGAISQAVSVNIVVNSINDLPVFSIGNSLSLAENSLVAYSGLIATDIENDTLIYSLGTNADSELFTINESGQKIAFTAAPDFENPKDNNEDNIYEIELLVDDGQGEIITKNISVVVDDASLLQATITYPTPNANLGGYAVSTTVSGHVVDLEDGEVSNTDIAALTINELAVTTNSANTRFTVQVPVTEGENALVISNDLSTQSIFNFKQTLSFDALGAGDLDIENNRLIVSNGNLNAIMAVDLTSKALTMISDRNVGTGEQLSYLYSMALSRDKTIAYVLDTGLNEIFSIDMNTGNRALVSGEFKGSGDSLVSPKDLAVDDDIGLLYVVDSGLDAILRINISTGDRVVISDSDVGSGTNFGRPEGIAIFGNNTMAYVADSTKDNIFIVDLSTGERTVLSARTASADGQIGICENLVSPERIKLSADGSSLFVADNSSIVYSIDTALGTCSLIASDAQGSGIDLANPTDVIVSSQSDVMWVLDSALEEIVKIDLTSGERELFKEANNDSLFLDPSAALLDSENDRLFEVSSNTIYSVDLSNSDQYGTVTVIAGPNIGAGYNLIRPGELMLDSANNRLFTVDFGASYDPIYQVDISTGDRTLIAEASDSYRSRVFIGSAIYDSKNERILYTDDAYDEIVAVDVNTGVYSLISDGSASTGNGFSFLQSIAINTDATLAYVSDSELETIFAVDLASGNPTVISSESTGNGLQIGTAEAMAFDGINNRLFATNDISGLIFSVDIESGDREHFSVGSMGTEIHGVFNLELDSTNERLFVADFAKRNIYVIDIESGERAIAFH